MCLPVAQHATTVVDFSLNPGAAHVRDRGFLLSPHSISNLTGG
jgi:hypothetical protein